MTRTNEFGQAIGEPVVWSPRERPGRVVIEGRWVRLEPIAVEHAEALLSELAGPDDLPLWTYRPDDPPRDVAEMERLIAELADAEESVTWAIVPEGGRAAGMLSLFRIEEASGSAEVAAVIYGTRLQRTRAATEAIVVLGAHLFEELGYRRYEWKCDHLNEPSRRAAERLGFAYEGRFRNALVYKGRNRDTDWFAMTDQDWAALRPAYDAWLDPSNFDEAGRQREALGARWIRDSSS
jgi:RimJ/RimL family protein N-acetyltransferase